MTSIQSATTQQGIITEQPNINNQPSQAGNPAEVKASPFVKRTLECGGSLFFGALGGYLCYWMVRLGDKIGLLGQEVGPILPLPYVLSGLISAAIVETARLTYSLALHVIGKRADYENLQNPEKASCFDRLRQRTWKVINRVEGIERDIDNVFSKIFHIRPAKEVRDNKIPDRELYFMEVVRRAFWEQVQETIATSIPQNLAIKAVVALGHIIPGGEIFGLSGILLFGGLGFLNKITDVYNKIMKEDMALAKAAKEKAKTQSETTENAESQEPKVEGTDAQKVENVEPKSPKEEIIKT